MLKKAPILTSVLIAIASVLLIAVEDRRGWIILLAATLSLLLLKREGRLNYFMAIVSVALLGFHPVKANLSSKEVLPAFIRAVAALAVPYFILRRFSADSPVKYIF